jgi:hypothetical protein
MILYVVSERWEDFVPMLFLQLGSLLGTTARPGSAVQFSADQRTSPCGVAVSGREELFGVEREARDGSCLSLSELEVLTDCEFSCLRSCNTLSGTRLENTLV